jgi:translation initiation factor 4B
LKPRTVDTTTSAPTRSAGSKPDPFGGAKPVDTAKALDTIEKKHESDMPKKEE